MLQIWLVVHISENVHAHTNTMVFEHIYIGNRYIIYKINNLSLQRRRRRPRHIRQRNGNGKKNNNNNNNEK